MRHEKHGGLYKIVNLEMKEGAESFIYLEVDMNNANSISQEINKRIFTGNRTEYLRSDRKPSPEWLKRYYITLLVTYGSEAKTLTGADISALQFLKGKYLKKNYSPVNVGEL